MATSPEPAGSPGRRVSRWLILVLLLAVAGLAISTPAMAATTTAAATTAPTATTRDHGHHRQPHPGRTPRTRRCLPGTGHRGHRRPGRAVCPGIERDRR